MLLNCPAFTREVHLTSSSGRNHSILAREAKQSAVFVSVVSPEQGFRDRLISGLALLSSMSTITLTRQRLYDRAWTTPPRNARQGTRALSGRGLGKLCDRHDVPVPPGDGKPRRPPGTEFGKHLCRRRVRGWRRASDLRSGIRKPTDTANDALRPLGASVSIGRFRFTSAICGRSGGVDVLLQGERQSSEWVRHCQPRSGRRCPGANLSPAHRVVTSAPPRRSTPPLPHGNVAV